jgi:hypothetical protein
MNHREGAADGGPLDMRSAEELITRVRREIDNSSDERRDLLLHDLMCAAWPTFIAQEQ